jgi:ABC-type multidrug transport system fused ATPase/permease subunit
MTKVLKLGVSRSYIYGAFIGLFTVFVFGAIVGVLWYGGTMVIKQKKDFGFSDLMSFLLYTMNMSFSLLAAGGTFNQIITAVGIAESLFEKMDEPAKIVNGELLPA